MTEHNMSKDGLDASKDVDETKKLEKKEAKRYQTVHPAAEKPLFVILGILLGALIVGLVFFVASVTRDVERAVPTVPLAPIDDASISGTATDQAVADTDDSLPSGEFDSAMDGDAASAASGVDAADDTGRIVVTPSGTEKDLNGIGVKPSNRAGSWNLIAYNKQEFDDNDDDEKYEIDNVCGDNRGVTTYCKNTGFSSSSAPTKGNDKCPACTVGQTCLLWDDDEEDDGELEVETATYLCE